MSDRAIDLPVLDIEASSGWRAIDFGELWRYRELFWILIWRDLKVRYRQTVLGAAWVIVQPLLTMLIFTFLFNRVAKIEAGGGISYAVFVLAGLLPWNFFASALQNSGNSLVGSSHLISKVYFPRLLVPAASVAAGLVDFSVTLVLLGGLLAWRSIIPGAALVMLPVIVAVLIFLAAGFGLWISALNVEFRDARVAVPFVLQIWMYATPVVYPLHILPERFRRLAFLNPMTGITESFRNCLTRQPIPWPALAVSAGWALAILVTGAYFFRRTERIFADVI
jgi:lipopolysaccharide transport system permease protein